MPRIVPILVCLIVGNALEYDVAKGFAQTTRQTRQTRQRTETRQAESQQSETRTRLFPGKMAEKRAEENRAANEKEQAKQETLRRIPWNALPPGAKEKAKGVLADVSLFHRLPDQTVYCESWIYDFMLKHPDVVVAFWEKLGVTQISLRELESPRSSQSAQSTQSVQSSRAGHEHGGNPPGKPEEPTRFRLKESVGTVADLEILYKTPNYALIYAKGYYQGPFFAKTIEGEALLVLRSRYAIDADDDPYVVCRLDAFINIHNPGADMIIRLLAGPVGKIADANFEQTISFIGSVSEAIHENPRSVYKTVGQLPHVRREVLGDFQDQIAAFTAHQYRRANRTSLALSEFLKESPEPASSASPTAATHQTPFIPRSTPASRNASAPIADQGEKKGTQPRKATQEGISSSKSFDPPASSAISGEKSADKSFDPDWMTTLTREFGESSNASTPLQKTRELSRDTSSMQAQIAEEKNTEGPAEERPEAKRVIFKTPTIPSRSAQ